MADVMPLSVDTGSSLSKLGIGCRRPMNHMNQVKGGDGGSSNWDPSGTLTNTGKRQHDLLPSVRRLPLIASRMASLCWTPL